MSSFSSSAETLRVLIDSFTNATPEEQDAKKKELSELSELTANKKKELSELTANIKNIKTQVNSIEDLSEEDKSNLISELEETIDTLTDTEKQDTMDKIEDAMDKIEDIISKLGEIVDKIQNNENEDNEDLYQLIRLLGIIRIQANDAEKQKIKDEISSIFAKITGEIKNLIK